MDIQLQGRSLRLIAADIQTEWDLLPGSLRAPVIAMSGVASIADHYGPYSMRSLVEFFVASSDGHWDTSLAKRVRAELRAML